jgi:glyoxylase-like metal-dependent hydrolase (beta-lactamase superfamily II)
MPAVMVDVAPGITAIDTFMAGRERYTAAYLLQDEQPTLVETGPTTSVEPVTEALHSLGIGPDQLASIIVTHIHLDHAGGVGRLSSRFPRATVYVHERGAPHLADPSRLVASAARVYGEDRMAEWFGPVDPVAQDRIQSIGDGDRIELRGRDLEVLYTPGHASHHVALVDSATGAVMIGDALGIHVPDLPVLRPATPPPDFDLDLAIDSIDRIRSRAGSAVLFAHFGPIEEVDRICELAERRVRGWAEAVRETMGRTDDIEEVVRRLQEESSRDVETGADAMLDLDALEERLQLLSSIRINAMGLVRYWKKRAEADAAADGGGPHPS